MNDAEDQGFTVTHLRVAAWVMGLVAAGCLVRLASYPGPDDGASLDPWMLVWLLAGMLAGIASACAAVIVAIKLVERRSDVRAGRPSHR